MTPEQHAKLKTALFSMAQEKQANGFKTIKAQLASIFYWRVYDGGIDPRNDRDLGICLYEFNRASEQIKKLLREHS